MKISRFAGSVLVASVCVWNTTIVEAQQTPQTSQPPKTNPAAQPLKTNPDAAILVDFKERIDAYLKLRGDAVKGTPPLEKTSDPKKIQLAEEAMALNIQTARAAAKPGDILTPQIQDKFRRLLAPETKGEDGRDAKAILKDDAPNKGEKPAPTIPAPPPVKFKVNAKYPEGASLPTVPANLLLNLPTLPKELEYRIIDKHLILRDVDANMVVDYMLNAIK